jgi:HSP20 family protein
MRNKPSLSLTDPFRLLDAFFTDQLPEAFPGNRAPATDIAETTEAFLLSLEMPGVAEDAIQLDLHKRKLTVTAERAEPDACEGQRWHRREQRFGKWARTFQLPESADCEAVEATYRQGVLCITVAKLKQSQPVRIQVKGR